ncbi:hypothetical protein HELRODRAFT_177927 [Helobdella robusta]|uniref:Uncharacterized protein n=1 Tax=Helobdella robusta TaxID=6412 RepID=T1FCH2_HELRO|nr:hypothetical protein HELRODRAFT_177927 [Helobdella robusta]ESN97499.1 hypothetical protein HELRODRAFT_177927 [Helobdella robusta]
MSGRSIFPAAFSINHFEEILSCLSKLHSLEQCEKIPPDLQKKEKRDVGSSLFGSTQRQTLVSYVPKKKPVISLFTMSSENFSQKILKYFQCLPLISPNSRPSKSTHGLTPKTVHHLLHYHQQNRTLPASREIVKFGKMHADSK